MSPESPPAPAPTISPASPGINLPAQGVEAKPSGTTTPQVSHPVDSPVHRPGPNLALWQRMTLPLVRAYARWQLPSAGWVLHYWGMNRAEDWRGAPTVLIRERRHSHKVRLRLDDFFQRCAYFMSSYHEQDVLTVLEHGLRPGDAFVDGGANIGLITLYAAGLVGPAGRVDAFEPSPELIETTRWHIETNALHQVRLHQLGLSEEANEFPMVIPALDNTGAGTLGKLPARYGKQIRQVGVVRTTRGDDILDPADQRPLFVKLDIEGFEHKALQGFGETLTQRKPAILCEMLDEMLRLNGSSSLELFDFLVERGYAAFGLDRQGWRKRHGLWLHPVQRHQMWCEKDVLWLHENSPMWDRYKDCIQKPGLYWKHHKLIKAGYQV